MVCKLVYPGELQYGQRIRMWRLTCPQLQHAETGRGPACELSVVYAVECVHAWGLSRAHGCDYETLLYSASDYVRSALYNIHGKVTKESHFSRFSITCIT